MAKTLAERIISAKSTDRVTITDLATLIADATAEHSRLTGSAEHHDKESIDFALSDDDREEASRLTGHFQRTARGLANEIDALKQKLEEKRNSEKRLAEEAARAAIIARRDDIAARFAKRGPALIDELIGLLSEIEASDDEMAAARIYEPSAEAVARGVSGTFFDGQSPIARYLKLKIPEWSGGLLRWPIDRQMQAMVAREQLEHRRAVEREKARRAEEARWSLYVVDPAEGKDSVIITTRRGKEPVVSRIQRQMTAEAAEEARKGGCIVLEMKPGDRRNQLNSIEMLT